MASGRCKNCGVSDHNPNKERTGHFTGRCGTCGSKHLWDDASAYGCKCCDAIYMTENIAPRKVENSTGRDLGPAW